MGILVLATSAKPTAAGVFAADPSGRPARQRNELVLAGIALGSVIFLALTTMLLVLCLKAPENGISNYAAEKPDPGEPTDPSVSPSTPSATPTSQPSEVPPILSSAKAGPSAGEDPVAVHKPGDSLLAVVKVAGSGYPGVDQIKVDEAIARGVAFLKDPGAINGSNIAGLHGLAGLTLLSCGAATDDAAVARNAEQVRAMAGNLKNTYELAVCILFLDRLGEARDGELIRRLALRLIAGQGICGGWGYVCATLNPAQEEELLGLLKNPAKIAPKESKVPPRSRTAKSGPGLKTPPFGRPVPVLPSDLRDLPAFRFQPDKPLVYQLGLNDDNSLTQFAILALWSAQKYGIAADRSLTMAEARFRASQAEDGSWCYRWRDVHRCKYSMTCAGLLGLAAGRGSERGGKDSKKGTADPAIEKALRFVSQEIGTDHVAKWLKTKQGTYNDGYSGWGGLYFLWSLERAAVVYDLRTIGGKDWYAWGAPIILETQQDDGSWKDTFPGVPDTCFALLFLKRTNVVQDLTRKIQFLTMSKETGERMREAESAQDPTLGRRSEFSGNVRPGRVRGLKGD